MSEEKQSTENISSAPKSAPKSSAKSEGQSTAQDVIEKAKSLPEEKGGRKGPEPVRYGDWEMNGKCVDF